jgi:hypothetical protein
MEQNYYEKTEEVYIEFFFPQLKNYYDEIIEIIDEYH